MQEGRDEGPRDTDGDEHGEEYDEEHEAPGGSGMGSARFGWVGRAGKVFRIGHKFQCTASKFCNELAKQGHAMKMRGHRRRICNTNSGKLCLIERRQRSRGEREGFDGWKRIAGGHQETT